MPGPARWLVKQADRQAVEALGAALSLEPPAAAVLCSRGYPDAAGARRFLRPSLDDLHDPMALAGMDRAVERLRRAIRNGERILLYGDYDVDGTTSIVILKRAIELAGGAAEFHVPHRLRDGYGMREDVIEAAAARGISLIISVDTGIRAAAAVRRAAGLGIDVVITDHHLPEAELPPAWAVLNPNRRDCAYPEKNLCGVGVTFKLVHGLLATLDWPPERLSRVLESFLKLVAIGTVADVVPLTGENRAIVKHGLEGLRQVRNPGLRALLEVAGFRGPGAPTAGQVAFRLAPRINAAGRMAAATDVIELFLTGDARRAGAIAGQLDALNAERQKAEAEILEECLRTPVDGRQAALVFCGTEWHRGVLGIVASRLVERFHRPVFVLSREDGRVQGSGRSIPGFHLLEALEAMPELFLQFGGHKHAAGLALEAAQLESFRARFQEYAAARLGPEDFLPLLEIDAVIGLDEITDRSAAEIASLAPFGCGNPVPRFAALAVEVAGPPVVWKEKHLRVALRQGRRTLWMKAWNFAGRAGEFQPGARVDAAFTVEEDRFAAAGAYPAWSAFLSDVRPAAAATPVA